MPENDARANFHTSAPQYYTGKLAKVNRQFDYFSNAFTDTQKGEKQSISLAGRAPVVTSTQEYDLSPNSPLMLFNDPTTGKKLTAGLNQKMALSIAFPAGTDSNLRVTGGNADVDNTTASAVPRNLFADLTSISSFDINNLREIEKLQKRQELDLVAGTRFFEIMENYFDVKSNLAVLDYPEQIAYSKGQIDISQVVQTSAQETGATTPQGNVAGYGVGVTGHGQTALTIMEYSVIIPFMYITQRHTYQQGLHKFHNRRTRTDFFDPLQIGLGFQPIYKSEIYGHLKDSEKDDV